jgi:hypothetical protein
VSMEIEWRPAGSGAIAVVVALGAGWCRWGLTDGDRRPGPSLLARLTQTFFFKSAPGTDNLGESKTQTKTRTETPACSAFGPVGCAPGGLRVAVTPPGCPASSSPRRLRALRELRRSWSLPPVASTSVNHVSPYLPVLGHPRRRRRFPRAARGRRPRPGGGLALSELQGLRRTRCPIEKRAHGLCLVPAWERGFLDAKEAQAARRGETDY